MASGLSKKVSAIEQSLSLLGFFRDRLLYLQPSLNSLLESAAEDNRFPLLGFHRACLERMRTGSPFPQSWREAVETERGLLGKESAELLADLDTVLGSTDLDSQLSALDFARQQLELQLRAARDYRQRHQKLYSTLGVLCGIALVIILV